MYARIYIYASTAILIAFICRSKNIKIKLVMMKWLYYDMIYIKTHIIVQMNLQRTMQSINIYMIYFVTHSKPFSIEPAQDDCSSQLQRNTLQKQKHGYQSLYYLCAVLGFMGLVLSWYFTLCNMCTFVDLLSFVCMYYIYM